MDYRLPLVASAVLINTVHGLLLVVHKLNRRLTISEHAVLGKKSFGLYVIGHLLNGLLFLWFAKSYFINEANLPLLFVLALWTVSFEFIQAIIPAGGDKDRPHTNAALIMWLSFILLGLLCIVFVPVELSKKMTAATLYSFLIIVLVHAGKQRKRGQKFYIHQMVMVVLFYVSMILLVW